MTDKQRTIVHGTIRGLKNFIIATAMVVICATAIAAGIWLAGAQLPFILSAALIVLIAGIFIYDGIERERIEQIDWNRS